MSTNPIRIMFVCTGNICRSPLAHRVLEARAAERGLADRLEVESSGIGSWHVGEDADARMRATAEAHGVPFHHPAQQIRPSDLETFDVLFAMDRGHERELIRMAHRAGVDPKGRVRLFRAFDPESSGREDVPDPYYGGQRGFEEVWSMVDRTVARMLDAIEEGTLP